MRPPSGPLPLLPLLVLPLLQFEGCIAGDGPSAESLRRYLNLYEQQRRLEQQKAAYYPEVGGTHFAADSQGEYGGQPVGDWLQEPPQKNAPAPPKLWRGKGQPEVFADDTPIDKIQGYPQQDDLQLSNTGKPWTSADRTTSNLDPEIQKKAEQTPSDGEQSTVFRQPLAQPRQRSEVQVQRNPLSDIYFVVIVAGCSAAAIFGVIAAGYCFYRFQKNSKAAAEVDYPAYGVTGPNKDQTSPNGDRRLAQSAQMYHYQHQKQQMIAVEKATTARNTSASDIDSEEENEEGDYTVYECPGLAPTGEMEVKNPLFQDDSTPMSPPVVAKDLKKQ